MAMATKKVHRSEGTTLYRSETNKMLGGVCGGLGEVFDIDPTVIRVLFLIALFFGGSGFLLYLILWIVIPTKSKVHVSPDETIRENVEELKDKAQETVESFRSYKFDKKRNDNSKTLFGVLILAFGIIFLMGNFGFRFFNLHQLWPVLLIILGIFMLFKHERN